MRKKDKNPERTEHTGKAEPLEDRDAKHKDAQAPQIEPSEPPIKETGPAPEKSTPAQENHEASAPEVQQATDAEKGKEGAALKPTPAAGPRGPGGQPVPVAFGTTAAPKEIKPPMKWEIGLLAGSLIMGLTITIIIFHLGDVNVDGMRLFTVVYLMLAGLIRFTKGAFERRNRIGDMAFGASVILCIANFIYDTRWMMYLNLLLVIPNMLMAASVWVRYGPGEDKKYPFSLEFLYGWFYRPFAHISRFFTCIYGLVGKQKRAKGIVTGLLISVPLIVVLGSLLMSADEYFTSAVTRWLSDDVFAYLGRFIFCVMMSVLLFSFLHTYREKPFASIQKAYKVHGDVTIVATVLSAVLVLYALFCGFQFVYLFGGRSAAGSGVSHAVYARQGFMEICVVAAINMFIYCIVTRFFQMKPIIKGLLMGLLLSTGIMLASSVYRLYLYIEAYGITALRLFAGWGLVVLTVWLIVAGVHTLRPTFPLYRSLAGIALTLYVLIQIVSPDAVIARMNMALYRKDPQKYASAIEYCITSLDADAFSVCMDLYQEGKGPFDADLQHEARYIVNEETQVCLSHWMTVNKINKRMPQVK